MIKGSDLINISDIQRDLIDEIMKELQYYNISIKENEIKIEYDSKRKYLNQPKQTNFHKIMEFCKEKYPHIIDVSLENVALVKDLWETIQCDKNIMKEIVKIL